MQAFMLACTLLLSTCFICKTHGSNWVQVSGKRHTNAAVLGITPWTRRHGHAVASLDFTEEYMKETGRPARLFVLGGDSSVQGIQDLRAYPGGGSFKNDVWATTGVQYDVRVNILKKNQFGDPLPQAIANISWLQTNNGKQPPRGVTWSEWLVCASNPWAIEPVKGCDDPSQPPGAYLADNMFSPRRNFVAIAFKNELYVMGGRAREHAPVPEDHMRAGVVGTIGPRNVRWREYAVLKNDVWRSSDAGASWKLVTPGCLMPQQSLVHKSGDKRFQCDTDDQCEGDSSCKFDTDTSTGFCVCNMWSPREFHAVIVHEDKLFLSGGYALVQLGNCGVEESQRKRPSGEEFACGGGYRAYMNDVWMSTDGQNWKLLTLHGGFSPRGEHAMVSFKSLLYIFGGRTGDSIIKDTKLLNDVWISNGGSEWKEFLHEAPWSPRAKHVVAVLPGAPDKTSVDDLEDELVLMYGEDEERVLGDVWTWKGSSRPWIQDYAQGTVASVYVSPESDIENLQLIKKEHASILHEANIHTIRDLASVDFDTTIQLRDQMPFCDYLALAKAVNTSCTVTMEDYDGEEFAHQKIIQGKYGDILAQREREQEEAQIKWDGCFHYGEPTQDRKTGQWIWPDVNGIEQVQHLRDIFDDAKEIICKWHPSPRSGHAGTLFQRKIFILGGLINPDQYENDVWYRDKRRPQAQFTLVPASESSETIFKFESNKPGCIFEYHITNMVEMLVVRNWTKTLGEVNFINWLDGGKFRFRVRAVDPSGNVDISFELLRNEHIWIYIPKLPWGLILGFSSVFLVFLGFFLFEWRKRRKRAAMERYAMKRMRRKLKGTKKNDANTDTNWRTSYDKAKDQKKTKTKGKFLGVKKKTTNKKSEKTEKNEKNEKNSKKNSKKKQ